MPIYAYRCEACGFDKDVLQKLSDAPLTQCPSCGKDTFRKQVTAAGFQLKGSGWYVTDFRGGNGNNGGGGGDKGAPATEAKSTGGEASSSEGSSTAASSPDSSSTATTAPAASTNPAAGTASGS
ncbi:MAG TPA: zinc ribbon domain-containing protein [Paraburkholderia sp.]|jgi:putative FmdB family regulatory protein